jgi:DNA polymerase I-like protein with 3'-5' exonuclease and polymerase domains
LITVFDIETSYQVIDNKKDPSPKHPNNFIVSIGINEEYFFFRHSEYTGSQHRKEVQDILDKTTLLVGHNIKFDLSWIYEVGFNYSGKIFDTMIGVYVLGRGAKQSLKLKDCCTRRNVSQKSDLTEQYIKRNVSFENIPLKIVDEYGRQDIVATKALFQSQMKDLKLPRNKGLIKTIKMMCEFCAVLTQMENNGIRIDLPKLDEVEKEFQLEHDKLRIEIDKIIHNKMGDTKINPSSPEQLSKLIYGVQVVDKKSWVKDFNIGIDKYTKKPKKRPRMSNLEFKKTLMMYLMPMFKTKASQCFECKGKGYIQKFKVNGDEYKNMSKCPTCKSEGVVYNSTKERAGFGARAQFVSDASEGGFKTDRITLLRISSQSPELNQFVEKITRYNALETYLSTFIEGIKKHTKQDSFLYPNFMQCITRTGRLSSRDPNFQNQPRGGTFPIRKVITSRFEKGKVAEIDFAQLEFRTAVFLAQDEHGMEDIKNGVDVHQYTADIIGVSRQQAKGHTFKPLYGGTSGTDDEKRYYDAFKDKYKGIALWHEKLQDEADKYKMITLPTGRQYGFPSVERMPWGGTSFSTQIKNYPVQGFATGDIVPLACINIQRLITKHNLKSMLINTVHDSVVADIHPDEESTMVKVMREGSAKVIESLKEIYDIDFNVPLDTEIKIGYDWLDLEVVE